MQWVTLLADTPLATALDGYVDPDGRFSLKRSNASVPDALTALGPLNVAGAVISGAGLRSEAFHHAHRTSVDAGRYRSVDTLVQTRGLTVGELTGPEAVVDGLHAAGWDARGASVVAIGGGVEARALLGRLVSSGVRELTVVEASGAEAEQALPDRSSGVTLRAMHERNPAIDRVLSAADAVLLSKPLAAVNDLVLGPHLTLVELMPDLPPTVRQRLDTLGGATVPWHDLAAHQTAWALKRILETDVDSGPLLQALHHRG